MHRELCAHSPTGAQSAQAIGMPGTPGEQGLWQWQSERQAGQWPGAPSGLQLRSPDSAARQASVAQSHQPFCRRRTSLIHQKSRFFIVAIGKRRLRHRMRLFALITMVCSDLAYCNASSLYCKSKSGAPWRARHRVSCLHPPWRGMVLSFRNRSKPLKNCSKSLARYRSQTTHVLNSVPTACLEGVGTVC